MYNCYDSYMVNNHNNLIRNSHMAKNNYTDKKTEKINTTFKKTTFTVKKKKMKKKM